MRFTPQRIPEVVVVEPDVYRDPRGFFLESYSLKKYREAGIGAPFVQDNHSYSVRATLRGLHAQKEHPQGKLVRCIEGEIFDVAVDIRRGSPTFGQWVAARLSAENCHQIWVPVGFAHGFCVVSDVAQVEYKVTDDYHPEDELGILWNDPEIGIEWPEDRPILSKKDAGSPPLADVLDLLPRYEGTTP